MSSKLCFDFIFDVLGKAFYLRNFTRMSDIEGKVFHTFPLKTDSVGVVAAIREQQNKTKLSLLDWDSTSDRFQVMKGK